MNDETKVKRGLVMVIGEGGDSGPQCPPLSSSQLTPPSWGLAGFLFSHFGQEFSFFY